MIPSLPAGFVESVEEFQFHDLTIRVGIEPSTARGIEIFEDDVRSGTTIIMTVPVGST